MTNRYPELRTFIKQPAESYVIAIEWAGRLPIGATLSSGTVSAVNVETGITDNTVLASTTATISGTQARVKVTGGTLQTDYKITFLCTFSSADVLEEDVVMMVRAR
jgi:hypothetical protein